MVAYLYSFHIKINKQKSQSKVFVRKTNKRYEGSMRHKNFILYELKILN